MCSLFLHLTNYCNAPKTYEIREQSEGAVIFRINRICGPAAVPDHRLEHILIGNHPIPIIKNTNRKSLQTCEFYSL